MHNRTAKLKQSGQKRYTYKQTLKPVVSKPSIHIHSLKSVDDTVAPLIQDKNPQNDPFIHVITLVNEVTNDFKDNHEFPYQFLVDLMVYIEGVIDRKYVMEDEKPLLTSVMEMTTDTILALDEGDIYTAYENWFNVVTILKQYSDDKYDQFVIDLDSPDEWSVEPYETKPEHIDSLFEGSYLDNHTPYAVASDDYYDVSLYGEDIKNWQPTNRQLQDGFHKLYNIYLRQNEGWLPNSTLILGVSKWVISGLEKLQMIQYSPNKRNLTFKPNYRFTAERYGWL